MSNIIVTKLHAKEDFAELVRPTPNKKPRFKGDNTTYVHGVWDVTKVGNNTFIISHHHSALGRLEKAGIAVFPSLSRDIDGCGVHGLPSDMLSHIDEKLVKIG